MKDKLIIGLLAISIVFNVVNFYRSSCKTCAPAEAANETKDASKATTSGEVMPAGTIEVADVMTKLQRHMNKLWFAGSNQNWTLANFYTHELEESEDIITDNNVIDEQFNLSQLIKVMGKPPLKELSSAINAQDPVKFKEKYLQVITNCNACHSSTKHEFVIIKQPTTPAYDNQDYSKH